MNHHKYLYDMYVKILSIIGVKLFISLFIKQKCTVIEDDIRSLVPYQIRITEKNTMTKNDVNHILG